LYFEERLEFDKRARRLKVTSGNVTLKDSFHCQEESSYWADPADSTQTKFEQFGKVEDKIFGPFVGGLIESFAVQIFNLYGQKVPLSLRFFFFFFFFSILCFFGLVLFSSFLPTRKLIIFTTTFTRDGMDNRLE
jgi:hypothetical protein